MRSKSIGSLIVTLFVGVLIGSALGQLLGLFLPQDHIVAKALISPLVPYKAGPWDLNLVIMVITFGFTLNINFFSILGIVGAWYYHKYSY
jgi:H+/Cl- antiporter ClcA